MKASTCGRPSIMRRLQPHLVPVQAAVLAAALPFDRRAAPELGQAEVAQHAFGGVRAHARSDVGDRTPAQLLRAAAIHFARLAVGLEHVAAVPVVDEDRVLGGFEDRAVARLGALQRFARGQPLHLGGGTHGEDLEDRLDPLELLHRPARGDRDDAQRRAVECGQRMAGVALVPCVRASSSSGNTAAAPARRRGRSGRAPSRTACRRSHSGCRCRCGRR